MHTKNAAGGLLAGILAVACAPGSPATAPGTGTLTVGVVAAGPNVQALSFQILFDSNPLGPVSADAGVFSRNVPVGEHVVALGDIPARCRVDGESRRTVKIVEDRVTPIRFSVSCR